MAKKMSVKAAKSKPSCMNKGGKIKKSTGGKVPCKGF